jgi:hypothetical protein
MNDYEAKIAARRAANKQLLQSLDLPTSPKKNATRVSPRAPKSHSKVKKTTTLPARASARLAARPDPPVYKPPKDLYKPIPQSRHPSRRTEGQQQAHEIIMGGTDEEDEKHMHANTINGWILWEPVEPEPTRDEDGTFHFASHPNFRPNKAPREVMREGAFGGTYWRKYHSLRLGLTISEDWRELPATWLRGINPTKQLTNQEYDPIVNKFGVRAGQTIEDWERSGWINHQYDVRGWFQWYCRFFQGRRCDDDDRQISRWSGCVGENGRWRRTLLKKYVQAGVRSVTDEEGDEIEGVSPVIHQTLHHWAFEIRQNVLDEYWHLQVA